MNSLNNICSEAGSAAPSGSAAGTETGPAAGSGPEDGIEARFSHIYVEDHVRALPRCQAILERFPKAEIISIAHYKDVFNRRKQNPVLQHKSQSLILAAKEGRLIYPGAPVCQNFGSRYFYYTSCMMNCVYDCEYCFLKGMYPSGNLVMFLNLDDVFDEVRALTRRHPVYLCVSYDTDLLAVEPIAGFVREWAGFAAEQENLTIEIRTKCANADIFSVCTPSPSVIFAFTLSPQPVIAAFEHGTPSLSRRLDCAAEGLSRGFPVRLCFDPMIRTRNWRDDYAGMLRQTADRIPLSRVRDFSVGSFRISNDYLKALRRAEPDSAVVQYPFRNENGIRCYGKERAEEMEQYLTGLLQAEVGPEKIFLWREGQ